MSGKFAYTALPAVVTPLVYPPGWNPNWDFPGVAPPGWELTNDTEMDGDKVIWKKASVIVRPTSGLHTTESAQYADGGMDYDHIGSDTIYVRLSKGVGNATVILSTDNADVGEVVQNTLDFDGTNWYVEQGAQIRGKHRFVHATESIVYHVVVGGSALLNAYTGTITVTNHASGVLFDKDETAILSTSEDGEYFQFLVTLNHKPAGEVVVTLTSTYHHNVFHPQHIHFTAANWDVPVMVTVESTTDQIADTPEIDYTVGFTVHSDIDESFHQPNAAKLLVTNYETAQSLSDFGTLFEYGVVKCSSGGLVLEETSMGGRSTEYSSRIGTVIAEAGKRRRFWVWTRMFEWNKGYTTVGVLNEDGTMGLAVGSYDALGVWRTGGSPGGETFDSHWWLMYMTQEPQVGIYNPSLGSAAYCVIEYDDASTELVSVGGISLLPWYVYAGVTAPDEQS